MQTPFDLSFSFKKQRLSLPPRIIVYEKLSKFEVVKHVEKALKKLRWDIQSDKDDDGVVNTNQQEGVFNIQTNNFNFREMRATNMPFNKSVQLPGAYDQNEEVAMQKLKN